MERTFDVIVVGLGAVGSKSAFASPWFSSPRLASFAPRVHRNRRRSRVWRFMLSRTYSYI